MSSIRKLTPEKAADLLLGFNGIKFPKEMPNATVLRYIAFPPPPSYFLPFKTQSGKVLPPRISLSMQNRIRETCKIAGVDPVKVVGLPSEPCKQDLFDCLPESFFLPKGYKEELQKYQRYFFFYCFLYFFLLE
jgi:hypothetical protein